jgi:hypothetical protein
VATPNANTIVSEFRRDVADNYRADTGAAITDVTSQNGNEWSYTEVKDLLVQAINELQQRTAGEVMQKLTSRPDKVGNALASVYSEYVKRTLSAVAHTAIPGWYGGAYAEITLPSDYGWLCAVAVAYGSSYDRGKYVEPDVFASMIDRKNQEHRRPYYTIEGTKLRIISRFTGLPGQASGAPVESQVEITYVSTQPDITLGGATDILMRMHNKTNILAIMKMIAARWKSN